jgi:asparagine synthase (glutamine-hydrolysing)
VILHAYEEFGDKCVQKFNGMFAFCIWDDKAKRLYLARDRLGIKPLYYYLDGERFVFASEIKAIFGCPEIPIRLNPIGILEYLSNQYVMNNETFIKGVRRVPAGSYLVINDREFISKQYWDFPHDSLDMEDEETISKVINQLSELLDDAVRIRLRSDVDVGSYLSGGVDSSAVSCTAAKYSTSQIQTFTAKFSEGPDYDETRYAKIVSNHAGTAYNELNVDLLKCMHELPDIIWQLDEPVAGPGLVPQYFISRLASKHVKVILGGQGGDELFGGYSWYRRAVFGLLLRRFGRMDGILDSISGPRFAVEFAKQEGLLRVAEGVIRFGMAADMGEIFMRLRSAFTKADMRKLIRGDLIEKESPCLESRFLDAFRDCQAPNLGADLLKFDIKYYLQALLHVEDRTGMAFGLESRLPLLDYRLVEAASRIPAHLKIGALPAKRLLREAVKNIIPREIYDRRDKKGFPTPIGAWLKGDGSHFVEDYLLSDGVRGFDFFEKSEVRRIFHRVKLGKRREAEKLWRCLCIAVWYRNWFVECRYKTDKVMRVK